MAIHPMVESGYLCLLLSMELDEVINVINNLIVRSM